MMQEYVVCLLQAYRALKQRKKQVKAEAQLKELQGRKESIEKNEVERNHQLKYRKIKFIEKKKVLRRMEKIRRKIAKISDPVKLKTLREELKSHKDDLEYIEYFPRDRNYVSLFVSTQDQKDKIEELRSLASAAARNKNRMIEDEDGFLEENKKNKSVKIDKEDTKMMSSSNNNVTDDFFVAQEESTGKDDKKRKHEEVEEEDHNDVYSNSSSIVLSKSKKRKLKKKRKKKKKKNEQEEEES